VSEKIVNDDVDYQSKSAVREVIGCLMQNPSLLASYPIEKSDFPELYHKLIFAAIRGLFEQGAVKITAPVIREYLEENSSTFFRVYTSNDGDGYVTKALAGSDLENFDKNYTELRKFSVLRELKGRGINVQDVFDPYEVDPMVADKQRAEFNKMSIEQLILFYRQKVLDTMTHYSPRSSRNSVKAGGLAAKEQKELWKRVPAFGLSYASNYQTTITKGMRPRKFSVSSAATGTGKL